MQNIIKLSNFRNSWNHEFVGWNFPNKPNLQWCELDKIQNKTKWTRLSDMMLCLNFTKGHVKLYLWWAQCCAVGWWKHDEASGCGARTLWLVLVLWPVSVNVQTMWLWVDSQTELLLIKSGPHCKFDRQKRLEGEITLSLGYLWGFHQLSLHDLLSYITNFPFAISQIIYFCSGI